MRQLGQLEATVMQHLWSVGHPVSVREMREALAERAAARLHHGDDRHGQPALQGSRHAGRSRERPISTRLPPRVTNTQRRSCRKCSPTARTAPRPSCTWWARWIPAKPRSCSSALSGASGRVTVTAALLLVVFAGVVSVARGSAPASTVGAALTTRGGGRLASTLHVGRGVHPAGRDRSGAAIPAAEVLLGLPAGRSHPHDRRALRDPARELARRDRSGSRGRPHRDARRPPRSAASREPAGSDDPSSTPWSWSDVAIRVASS